MTKWLSIAAVLIALVVVLGWWMWRNSPKREIERSKAAVAAAKSWHFHTVRHFAGLPSDTYEVDTLCPMFQHTTITSTHPDGTPLVHDSINYSGRVYVNVDGRWTLGGGTQSQINANVAGTAPIIECDVGPIGADPFTSLPYDAMLDGTVHRGDEREVEGDSCRNYDVTVSTPHDPVNKDFQFSLCINEADHLPRQTRHTPPGYSTENVSTYTKWNAMREPELPAAIPN